MKFLLAGIALSGHVAIGTILINRLHSTATPYWVMKIIDAIWVLWHVVAPLIWLVWITDPDRWRFLVGLKTNHLRASSRLRHCCRFIDSRLAESQHHTAKILSSAVERHDGY